MSKTNYAGIDYGLGRSNINTKTGIRYGVISQGSLAPEALDDVEYDYGEPHCPKCGNECVDSGDDSIPPTNQRLDWDYKGNDYACLACKSTFWSDRCFSDEPLGWSYGKHGYKLTDCLDSDIFVIESPYFTYAQFCSPCVPGACNLDSPLGEPVAANKCYCLGHDWFDDGKAPYSIYSVETGEIVNPQ